MSSLEDLLLSFSMFQLSLSVCLWAKPLNYTCIGTFTLIYKHTPIKESHMSSLALQNCLLKYVLYSCSLVPKVSKTLHFKCLVAKNCICTCNYSVLTIAAFCSCVFIKVRLGNSFSTSGTSLVVCFQLAFRQ